MGCRIPIRQMPVGILFSKDFGFFGKSEFANPLKVCGIIGKSEFANPLSVSDIIGNCYGLPNSDSANAGRHTFSQRSPFFLANRNLPTHYRSPFFLAKKEFANAFLLS